MDRLSLQGFYFSLRMYIINCELLSTVWTNVISDRVLPPNCPSLFSIRQNNFYLDVLRISTRNCRLAVFWCNLFSSKFRPGGKNGQQLKTIKTCVRISPLIKWGTSYSNWLFWKKKQKQTNNGKSLENI